MHDSAMPRVRNMRAGKVFGLLVALVMSAAAIERVHADGQHVLSREQIASTVADRIAREDADRAAVRAALARPEVGAMARSMGADPGQFAAVVDTLSGPDLDQAASTARQINQQLAGGATTITISTTTIIIALLLVILLIVAIK